MSSSNESAAVGKGFSWKTVILVSGAYASYHIGSGFASGQEVLQFFGSWGWYWPLIVPLVTAAMTVLCTALSYRAGWIFQFDKPNDVYNQYCGKYVARFMDVFSMVIIACIGLVMFAGSGATLHFYLGTPVFVGALFIGSVSVAVVWLGLEKVTDVLGVAGVFMVAIVLIAGLYTLLTSDVGLLEAQRNLADHVASGKVMQAGVFNIYNPVLAGVFYAGLNLLVSFVFMVALGKGMKSNKEVLACGIGSSILLTMGICFVLWAVVPNIDYVVESGSHIPMLAVVSKSLPYLTPLFTLVIIAGIFTTITGYLWLIGRRFTEDKTPRQKILVAAVAIVGIFGGAAIPFATLINILYPYAGILGLFLLGVLIYNEAAKKVVARRAVGQSAPAPASGTNTNAEAVAEA